LLDTGATQVFANGGSFGGAVTNPSAISFDLSALTLDAGQDYTLRINAIGSLPAMGNNAGFDNFVLNGDVQSLQQLTARAVNAPASFGLFAVALALLQLRRRTR
jgi:hypothetical protein